MYMQISPINILRYGTYVDIAAPLFSWPFLHHIVLPTLVEAQTGVETPASLYPLPSCSVKACFSSPLEHKGRSLSAVRPAVETHVGPSSQDMQAFLPRDQSGIAHSAVYSFAP